MLLGSRVLLRPPIDADKAFLFALRNDVKIQMQLMVLPRANTTQRVDEWLARITGDAASLFFIIAEQPQQEALGFIQLTRMDFVHGHGELGICLAEKGQGKGYAREALQLLEEYAVNIFRLRKIILFVLDTNQRAVHLYEKAEYSTVGVLKQHFYQQQTYHDVRLMEKRLTGGGEAR